MVGGRAGVARSKIRLDPFGRDPLPKPPEAARPLADTGWRSGQPGDNCQTRLRSPSRSCSTIRRRSRHDLDFVDTRSGCASGHSASARFEFWVGETCFGIWEPDKLGATFAPQKNGHLALHVDDVAAARGELEAKGVEFIGETFDTGVCHMAFFTDPDGNDLMLHHRYAPRS